MNLTIDPTGCSATEDLSYVQSCLRGVSDLLGPGGDLDDTARDRIALLLELLLRVHEAALDAARATRQAA